MASTLGKRYKGFTNLVWLSGNDFDVTLWSVPTNDVCVTALARGIASMDANHIQTAELGADYAYPDSLSDSNWWPIINLNLVYDFSQTYAGCYRAYSRTNLVPCFNGEQHYESEINGYPADNVEMGTPLVLRHQEYWTLLSGAAGQVYGNTYIWRFLDEWQNNLNTVGVTQLKYNTALFQPRSWWSLVPDTNQMVLTGGNGTYATNGLISTNDYATAASTPDGALVIVYIPTVRTVTVNLAALSAPAIAHWYDPTSGNYVAIAGSPFANYGMQNFTPPGNNSGGDGDWVLVLETNSPAITVKPVFIQQSYATPQTSLTQVAVTLNTVQTAGNANIVAIGWDDTIASISAVNDSAGNLYQVAVPTYRGSGMSQAIYYATGITGGSNTVTVTFDQPATYVDLRVAEYSGLSLTSAFDAGNSAAGNGTYAGSGSVATVTTNELIFGAGYTVSGFTEPGGGFALRVITSPDLDIVEDMVAAAPGSYNATATLDSDLWLMQAAAFKAAPPADIIVPQITGSVFSNYNFVIRFSTIAGQAYELQATTNLNDAWLPLVTNIAGTGGSVQVTDTNAPSHLTRFYRVKAGF